MSNQVFTLALPEEEGVSVQSTASNAWSIAGKLFDLAKDKLNEAIATKLPPREEVLAAAGAAYDKHVAQLEQAAKVLFIDSIGRLYDGIEAIVKS